MIIVTMINISYFCLFVVCDQFERTALHWAVIKGSIEIVKLLLNKGASVNLQNMVSFTL